jgi:23S rRNA (pseudouridine1915-N3)-methyltransferase
LKIHIISVGKTKESWLQEAVELYQERLLGTLQFQFSWVKDDNQLIQLAHKERRVIALDPEGKMHTSEEFSDFFYKEIEAGGAQLSFIIGGAEGLPDEIRNRYPLISLSRLTFTHQITRLILVEQVYRAIQIRQGTQYHKSG